MTEPEKRNYTVNKVKGLPILGMLIPAIKNPLRFVMGLSQRHGDIISFNIMQQKTILLNHPDLVHHVLVKNHKNYKKNKYYVRFESAAGLGLLTSNGEKWKHDRQKIQPFFDKKLVTDYHFEIVNNVSEKYKQKWLSLTEGGEAEIDVTHEMAKMTTEIILKAIFGKNIDEQMVSSLHASYEVLVEYLKNLRVIYNIDMRKVFRMPAYFRFRRALNNADQKIKELSQRQKREGGSDTFNMLALLINSEFSERDVRDHCASMVFAGFETTSMLMQWFWYLLDDRNDIADKLRTEMTQIAPCSATMDSSGLSYDEISKMDYLSAVLKETMRLYPPFWMGGREAIEDDDFGGFKIKAGTALAISQIVMHRHATWWSEPESFIPDRFLGDNEAKIIDGSYFPFSMGPRKCSGHMFAQMEAKIIVTKLLPLFRVKAINKINNEIYPSASLKLKYPLRVTLNRI